MANHVGWVINETSMINRLNGLTLIAERHGIDVQSLKRGEWILFVNRGYTSFALLGANNTMVYHKVGKGHLAEDRDGLLRALVGAGIDIEVRKAVWDEIANHYYE